MAGWHTTIFPPYFVAGAVYSGFAMVITLAVPIRKFYHLEDLVTLRHLDNMAKVMLVTGLIVASSDQGAVAYAATTHRCGSQPDAVWAMDFASPQKTVTAFKVGEATIAGTAGPSIGRDGTVSVTQAGTAAATQVGQLQLATFINAAGLESRGENLYVETVASGNASTATPGTNGAGMITQGYVETSNVNVAEELVNMIQTQRAYEINSKAITTSDQMLQKISQL